MKRFLRMILVSVLLVVFLPMLIASIFDNRQNLPDDPSVATDFLQTTGAQSDGIIISVALDDGTIVQMELEEYLIAVVLMEMPAEFEIEALKAQAVVARTYTMKRHLSGEKHFAAAVCTDSSCCQGFCLPDTYLNQGGNSEDLEKIKSAIYATKDQVLTYNGKLIDATYFSCSGGMTESALAVWGSEIPYLQAVSSPGEERANHYTDTVSFSTNEFEAILGLELSDRPEQWIESISYTAGGGIDTIQICGMKYKGTEIRKLLGLRSTAFVITALGNRVTITTKGFGHRVGMSQYGADAMAVSGSSYKEILSHYYQGTVLTWVTD